MHHASAPPGPRTPLLLILAASVAPGCDAGTSAPDPAGADVDAVPEVEEPSQPRPAPGPRVSFDAPLHDFGQVSDVEPLRHAFTFENVGDQRLVVTEVEASCGCTTTTLAKQSYEPGERGEIEAVWEAKGVGSQRKTITVSTNGRPARVVLTVSAELEPFVRLEPAYLQFGNVKQGEERILRAKLRCADPGLEILGVSSPNPHLSAHVIDDPEEGGHLLEVMLLPTAPWGNVGTQIEVDLRGRPDPQAEPIEHHVQVGAGATVHGELILDRSMFAVGRVDPGASFTSYVEVTRPGGEPFEVLEARLEKATPSTMEVRVERLEGTGFSGHRLVVDGEAGAHLGLIRGSVAFVTDVPGEPERRLSVMGMVRALEPHDH